MDQTMYPRIYVERTLALIKPDAVDKSEDIVDVILKSGFTILQMQKLQLSPEQCSDFYADQYGKLFFPSLTAYMSSGPIIALTLAHNNAIAHWKSIIGPANIAQAAETNPSWNSFMIFASSLRAKYGTSDLKNALHGSKSSHAAAREIKFIFPDTVIESSPKREATEEYLSRYVNPTLLNGLAELCRHKPLNPCTWLADWLIKHNPDSPQICDGAIVEEAE